MNKTTIAARKQARVLPAPAVGDPVYPVCWECHAYTPHIRRTCGRGWCTELYCAVCRRYSWGAGPVGCWCDTDERIAGQSGHRTKGEQPKFPVPRKGRAA